MLDSQPSRSEPSAETVPPTTPPSRSWPSAMASPSVPWDVLRRETWNAPEYEPELTLNAQASSDPGVGVPENVLPERGERRELEPITSATGAKEPI